MKIYEDMSINAVDGHCGRVVDVVVDPVRLTVTHLVVAPPGLVAAPHLIPISAVDEVADDLRLSWTKAQVAEAPLVRETDFLELGAWPHEQDGWDVGVVRTLAWPYYSSGHISGGGDDWPNHAGLRTDHGGGTESVADYDRIPAGTAEIRRESQVVSSDGHVVGHVDGLIASPSSTITHLVLDRGHLWGHREITIPTSSVSAVQTDIVHLTLTRDEVARLPSVPFHRHTGSR